MLSFSRKLLSSLFEVSRPSQDVFGWAFSFLLERQTFLGTLYVPCIFSRGRVLLILYGNGYRNKQACGTLSTSYAERTGAYLDAHAGDVEGTQA